MAASKKTPIVNIALGWVNEWYDLFKVNYSLNREHLNMLHFVLLQVELPLIYHSKGPKRRSLFNFRCAHFLENVWTSFFLLICLFFSPAGPIFWPILPVSLNSAGLMYTTTHESRPDPTFFIDQLSTDFYS